MPELTGGDAVYQTLRALGVDHVFGIVSVHNIPIYDAILRGGGITPVSVRHEQGALHAADGYARSTGKLGVAITSTGPGATNSMTGLFEAGFASSPVLMITGQVESIYYGKGKGVLHEAENQLPMLRTVAEADTVHRPEEIPGTLFRLASRALTGRPRPAAIEIPIDFQYARAEFDIPVTEGFPRLQPDRASIERAAEMLRNAQRPVIWAGGGVITAEAGEALTALAERLGAPVFTSTTGRGAIPENHPLAMGPLPQQPQFTPLFESADVILAVGTRFQAGATRNWAVALPGKLIHIDADPSVISRNYPADAAVVGDAALALAALSNALGSGQPSGDPSFSKTAQETRDRVRESIRTQIGPDYSAIMDAMRELLPARSPIVRDATVPAYLWGNRAIPILAPRTSVHSTSAAIGPGLPLAIGAAIGSGQVTALIQGDGGFMLNIGELATAAQYNVPVVICLFNDRGYGVLRSIEANSFEGRQFGVELSTPDFAAVARAMNVRGEKVGSAAEFRAAFGRAVQAGGPTLLDIDMTQLTPMAGLGAPPPPPRAR